MDNDVKKICLKKDESGVALLIVITAIVILSIIMVDMSFSSQVNRAIVQNRMDALQAAELAKTGVQMAILELEIHKQISGQIKGKDPISKAMRSQVDYILDFGFQYPPPELEDISQSVQAELETLKKESGIHGSVKATISNLEGLVNINFFAKSVELSEVAKYMLTELLTQEMTKDESSRERFRDFNIAEFVDDIADYIDPDTQRIRGGDENSWYQRQTPPRYAKNLQLDDITELRLVRGITDDIYNMLRKYVGVYGNKINVNKAPIPIIKALVPGIEEDDLNTLLKLRAEQPFTDQKDFEEYVRQTIGKTDFNQDPQIPLSGTSELFEIESNAYVGKAYKKATVVVERGTKTKILSWQIS